MEVLDSMFRRVDISEGAYPSAGKQLKMVLDSISEGNTEGVLWKDDESYILWDEGNIVLYIFGESSSRSREGFHSFFEEEIREEAERYSYVKVNDLTGRVNKSSFSDIEFRDLEKYFYGYQGEDLADKKSSVNDLSIRDIDRQFLEEEGLENLDRVEEEIEWMWPSLERYHERGFGKAALLKEEVVCWCTAEYVSESKCGIGIETLESHRRKGIATGTAASFVRDCSDRNMTPYWECSASNEASVKLAERLGFERMDEYRVWLGRF